MAILSEASDGVQQVIKTVLDGSIGASAVLSSVWLLWLETTLGLFLLFGVVILLVLRLVLAYEEMRAWWKKRKERK